MVVTLETFDSLPGDYPQVPLWVSTHRSEVVLDSFKGYPFSTGSSTTDTIKHPYFC